MLGSSYVTWLACAVSSHVHLYTPIFPVATTLTMKSFCHEIPGFWLSGNQLNLCYSIAVTSCVVKLSWPNLIHISLSLVFLSVFIKKNLNQAYFFPSPFLSFSSKTVKEIVSFVWVCMCLHEVRGVETLLHESQISKNSLFFYCQRFRLSFSLGSCSSEFHSWNLRKIIFCTPETLVCLTFETSMKVSCLKTVMVLEEKSQDRPWDADHWFYWCIKHRSCL